MALPSLHTAIVGELLSLRRPDGGFAMSVDGISEVEPTVVAILALRDDRAQAWLAARQSAAGGFLELDGRLGGPALAALAALALRDTGASRRALGFAIGHRGLPPPDAADPEKRSGWGWTSDARSTVEPTSRVLIAVNALAPADGATRSEAIRLLTERHCADGGWNYGNASVNDVDLRGYAQTTAMALVALQGGPESLVQPGLDFLRRTWRREPGGLTTAQGLLAFRLHGVGDEIQAAIDALAEFARRPSFLDRPLTVAWAAFATAPDPILQRVKSRA